MKIDKIIRKFAICSALLSGLAFGSAALAQEADMPPENDHIADRVLGDPDAPVTIIEYASLTCPHCDNFHENVLPLLEENYIDTGKAKLIYREVYFDGPGLLAASLARCVPEAQYFPMITALFNSEQNWLLDQETIEGVIVELSKIGVMAGLSKDEINTCLDDRQMQEEMIANSQTLMDDDNVRGTPTVIVNGTLVENWAWENLQAEIEKALAE